MSNDGKSAHPPLIEALLEPRCYPHPVEALELIETHISWVILTGAFAYKIKKPVNLGFLDFSSLERRRFFCQEELRLNRRLAPQLYQEVVPIAGTPALPVIGGGGPVVEYAVKMRQFPQSAQLDRLLDRRALQPQHIDQLARLIARFHQGAARAASDSPHGRPDAIHQPVMENFAQLSQLIDDPDDLTTLDRLRRWSEKHFGELANEFERRRLGGFVRECHGDLHLRNLALIDGEIVAFDCIEFNENLRWIDVISELAFLVMDLEDRGQQPLARRVLDAYLQQTGDYGGVRLLRFYVVYRAMVRAKVAAIRLAQPDASPAERARGSAEFRSYLALAAASAEPGQPWLIITHGLSGSGKTTGTQSLLEAIGAIRLRSDVERKRLFGRQATDRGGDGISAGIYAAEATRRTYDSLANTAAGVLQAGYPVIVDAAFLVRSQRDRFRLLAERLQLPFAILAFHAPRSELRARIEQRQRADSDASDADLTVLDNQLRAIEPLAAPELALSIAIHSDRALDVEAVARHLADRQTAC